MINAPGVINYSIINKSLNNGHREKLSIEAPFLHSPPLTYKLTLFISGPVVTEMDIKENNKW